MRGFFYYICKMNIISDNSVIMKMYNNIKKINVDETIIEAIEANAEDLTNLNRDMLRSGNDALGSLPDYAGLNYSLFKRDLSSYFATYPKMDLYLTGSWQDNKHLEIKNNSVLFPSSDSKNNDLVGRFGPEINDLNAEKLTIARSIVTETFNKSIHEKLMK